MVRNNYSSICIRYRFFKVLTLLLATFILPNIVSAQSFPSWYLVSFSDKNNSQYSIDNPSVFLSQKSIARRIKNNIAIDSNDLPVNSDYIDSLLLYNISVYNTTKWLNAALVIIETPLQLSQTNSLSIVDAVSYLAPFIASKEGSKDEFYANTKFKAKAKEEGMPAAKFKSTRNRIAMVDLDPLLNDSFNGRGVDIAVFDNGFNSVDRIEAFKHLYRENRIKAVRNFTNDGKGLYSSGSHGTAVLSTMAGIIDGEFLGSATGANYYLFQTEDNRYEYPIEEVNWLLAAEYADSIGVDIITSSLVYSRFDNSSLDHTHEQLDGQTAIISIAAHTASAKGIVVFNSAGNEGGGSWQKICFPSDADGIFTIGAVDQDKILAKFSSTGNSADGRIKPDLVAEGFQTPIIDTKGKVVLANGTSFSTPFMAGAVATFMQANSDIKAVELYDAIIKSANMHSKADSLMGFGIPDFYLANILLQNKDIDNAALLNDFKVLPNPFRDAFHVLFYSDKSQNIDIELVDLAGKNIYQKVGVLCDIGSNLIRIDYLGDLKAGMYIIKISTESEHYSQKVVKDL